MPSVDSDMPNPSSRKRRSRHGGWWFLLAVIVLHLLVRLFNPSLSEQSLNDFRDVMLHLLPAFGLMFLLLILFNLLLHPQQIKRWLGALSGARGWLLSIFGGIVTMGPSYIWYPLLKELKTQGMQRTLMSAFLYSRAIKIPLLPFMAHYFGLLYTLAFVANILVFSVINGLAIDWVMRRYPWSETTRK